MLSKPGNRFLLCLVLLIALGCGEESGDVVTEKPDTGGADDGMHKPFRGQVVINDMGVTAAHWGRDPYVMRTRGSDAPFIEGDTLTLTVSYSGGCEVHEFTLVASDAFMESYPVQLAVSLAHDANGDLCRGYPTETYTFGLAPIRDLYRENYQQDTGTIVLRLRDAPEDVPDLVYTFAP